jgi:hypothetical protein
MIHTRKAMSVDDIVKSHMLYGKFAVVRLWCMWVCYICVIACASNMGNTLHWCFHVGHEVLLSIPHPVVHSIEMVKHNGNRLSGMSISWLTRDNPPLHHVFEPSPSSNVYQTSSQMFLDDYVIGSLSQHVSSITRSTFFDIV